VSTQARDHVKHASTPARRARDLAESIKCKLRPTFDTKAEFVVSLLKPKH